MFCGKTSLDVNMITIHGMMRFILWFTVVVVVAVWWCGGTGVVVVENIYQTMTNPW